MTHAVMSQVQLRLGPKYRTIDRGEDWQLVFEALIRKTESAYLLPDRLTKKNNRT